MAATWKKILLAGGAEAEIEASAEIDLSGNLKVDTIIEHTAASGVTIDSVLLKDGGIDINGNEFILDADGDTSITADTDDQIDFKVGGTDMGRLDSSGHLRNYGRIYPGTGSAIQNSRYLFDDGTYIQFYGGISVASEITSPSYDLTIKPPRHLYLETGGGDNLVCRAGGDFSWQDEDDSDTTRMTLASATGILTLTGYLTLKVTDTDGATEGQLWFDASENKLKFYDGAAVQTITST